jgi:hypothetical protein
MSFDQIIHDIGVIIASMAETMITLLVETIAWAIDVALSKLLGPVVEITGRFVTKVLDKVAPKLTESLVGLINKAFPSTEGLITPETVKAWFGATSLTDVVFNEEDDRAFSQRIGGLLQKAVSDIRESASKKIPPIFSSAFEQVAKNVEKTFIRPFFGWIQDMGAAWNRFWRRQASKVIKEMTELEKFVQSQLKIRDTRFERQAPEVVTPTIELPKELLAEGKFGKAFKDDLLEAKDIIKDFYVFWVAQDREAREITGNPLSGIDAHKQQYIEVIKAIDKATISIRELQELAQKASIGDVVGK